jgi:hypothetical protein
VGRNLRKTLRAGQSAGCRPYERRQSRPSNRRTRCCWPGRPASAKTTLGHWTWRQGPGSVLADERANVRPCRSNVRGALLKVDHGATTPTRAPAAAGRRRAADQARPGPGADIGELAAACRSRAGFVACPRSRQAQRLNRTPKNALLSDARGSPGGRRATDPGRRTKPRITCCPLGQPRARGCASAR